MSSKEILQQVLKLKPLDRMILVECLLTSLDEPDSSIDVIWAEEAEKRLKAYRKGDLESFAMEDVFKSKI